MFTVAATRNAELRYGENPHQKARRLCRARLQRRERADGQAAARQRAVVQQPARSRQRAGRCAVVPRAGGVGDQAQQSVRRGDGEHAGEAAASGAGMAIRSARLAPCWVSTCRSMRRRPSCWPTPGRFIEAIVAPELRPGGIRDSHDEAQVESQRAAAGGRRHRAAGRRR